jgi:chromate transport protein ChrA
LPTPTSVDFFNAFSNFSFGFQTDGINTILLSCWPLIVLIGFFAIRKNQRFSPEISYLICAAIVPVVLAFGLSFVVKPFFISRYMISVIAPLTIVLVWFISHYNRRFALAAASLIILIISATSFQQLRSADTPVKEDYRGVAQYIAQNANPQDVVILTAPFTVFPFEYYYEGDAKLNTLPIWQRSKAGAIPAFNKDKLEDEVTQLNSGHKDVYLLLSQDQGYEDEIRDYYEGRFEQKYEKTYSRGLELRVYKVGYNDVPALENL